MDKMKMETANKTLENLAKLKEMFPEVITESKDSNGEIVSAVDAKKLEQLLSTKVIEGDESYDFTWVGKKQAMVEANRPIRKTLRPCKEESVDWEKTENLYIEGDNLDVLKLLQESYLNKIKMIYIDPPYNTGNDSFIYPDDYKTNKDLYDEEVGAIDESGYRMFKNTETNGRFHSSWCSMIYPRLKLARNLLSEDGVIFISIDDHEVESLKKMCNEVFGECNFVANMIWKNKSGGANDVSGIACDTEHLLVYTKNCQFLQIYLDKEATVTTSYNLIDSDGKRYGLDRLDKQSLGYQETLDFPIIGPDGRTYIVEHKNPNNKVARWRWGKDTVKERYNELVFKYPYVYTKNYEKEGSVPRNLLSDERFGRTRTGKTDFASLFDGIAYFSFPKPVKLIKHLLSISSSNDNSIILDFFSGSATTAHAVMQLNAEDGGNRKFIMVQLPEVCDEKSEAYKAGYTNICEIGKERIRRAGKKIKEETGKQDLDIGFRVLKLDESNMKDVYYAPTDYNQSMLDKMTSNVKEDRTPEDLLYACMLEWGLELSLPHKVENIAGYNVHVVNDGDLVACFDNRISEEAIKQIADKKPLRAVFRDSSFATDAARVNVGEIFKLKSPNTTIKVI